jgi:hypothetical protein
MIAFRTSSELDAMFWRWKKATMRFWRAAIALLLAANHAIVALGLPMPTPAPELAGGPFPCMNCPCGCRTAEHCWRGCCCHTMTEKLAWAKEHGVTPPDFVREAAEKESQFAAKLAEPAPPCPHCRKHESAIHANGKSEKAPPARRSVAAIKALECRGLGGGLLSGLTALLPRSVSFIPLPSPFLENLSCTGPLYHEAVLLLPTPPPRA